MYFLKSVFGESIRISQMLSIFMLLGGLAFGAYLFVKNGKKFKSATATADGQNASDADVTISTGGVIDEDKLRVTSVEKPIIDDTQNVENVSAEPNKNKQGEHGSCVEKVIDKCGKTNISETDGKSQEKKTNEIKSSKGKK